MFARSRGIRQIITICIYTSRRSHTIDSSLKSCNFLQKILCSFREILAYARCLIRLRDLSRRQNFSAQIFVTPRKSRTEKNCPSNPLNYKNLITKVNTRFDEIKKTRFQNLPILRKTWFRGREKRSNFSGKLFFFRSSLLFIWRIWI